MKYMGSKGRIAKYILPIMLNEFKKQNCEIFIDAAVGGANLLDKVDSNIERYGNDINEYLIELYNKLGTGWLPPKLITELDYNYIRQNKDEDKALTGYVAFAMSFGGKWFGGYRRDIKGTKEDNVLKVKNEIIQSRRSFNSIKKQAALLKGCKFSNKNIVEICPIKKALIYCDIPYKGTTKYKHDFDYDLFYNWCFKMKNSGHVIFVSEYTMPNEFKCVWEKDISNTLNITNGFKATEKLFIL